MDMAKCGATTLGKFFPCLCLYNNGLFIHSIYLHTPLGIVKYTTSKMVSYGYMGYRKCKRKKSKGIARYY